MFQGRWCCLGGPDKIYRACWSYIDQTYPLEQTTDCIASTTADGRIKRIWIPAPSFPLETNTHGIAAFRVYPQSACIFTERAPGTLVMWMGENVYDYSKCQYLVFQMERWSSIPSHYELGWCLVQDWRFKTVGYVVLLVDWTPMGAVIFYWRGDTSAVYTKARAGYENEALWTCDEVYYSNYDI